MRDVMACLGAPSDIFTTIVTDHLNQILCENCGTCDVFWGREIRQELSIKFSHALSEEEQDLKYELRETFDLRFITLHVLDLLNIKLHKRAKRDLMASNKSLNGMGFTSRDVKHFDAKVRNVYVCEYSAANLQMLQAASCSQELQKARLWHWASKKLENLASRLSFCPLVVEKMAEALFEEGKQLYSAGKKQEAQTSFYQALIHFESAAGLYKQNQSQHSPYNLYTKYAETCKMQWKVFKELGKDEEADAIHNLAMELQANKIVPEQKHSCPLEIGMNAKKIAKRADCKDP